MCSHCEDVNATCDCTQCGVPFCEECSKFHAKGKETKGHTFTSKEEKK